MFSSKNMTMCSMLLFPLISRIASEIVAALMFWSDSTHLANFGTAKLWPIYLLFGNVSKYICGQPKSGACQHVA
jgi:Plavaka transposase